MLSTLAMRELWPTLLTISLCLAACSGQDPQTIDESNLGEVGRAQQNVYLAPFARPAGAVVPRNVNGDLQLWVFACGADHVMRRRVGHQGWPIVWDRWLTVANSFPCATAPSIGRWRHGSTTDLPDQAPWGTDTLGVYSRSPTNRLIEAWYASDGSTSASDITNHVKFGDIAGNPSVVDAVDNEGASERIAVAVKRASDGEVFTFDFYQGSWHVQDTGSKATGDVFGVSYNQFGKSYLSIQTGPGQYTLLSRKYWSHPYEDEFTAREAGFYGVMTFSRLNGGIATVRGTSSAGDRTTFWGLDPRAFGTFQIPGDETSSFLSDGGLVSSPTGLNNWSWARAADGTLVWIDAKSGEKWKTTRKLVSAPAPVVDGQDMWRQVLVYSRPVSDQYQLFFATISPSSSDGRDVSEEPLAYPGNGVTW